jgi:hypothetical protein
MKIAFLIPMTSKGKDWKTINDSYIVKTTLKTLVKSINYDHEYKFFLGIDHDDPLFSISSNIEELNNIFIKNKLELDITIFKNIKKGHLTAMWNILYKKAYDENYDYFYQCGDDIFFRSKNWIDIGIKILLENNNIGVTGPKTNNLKFLTQALFSRKHYEIFGFLFPETITNWYCDNWLSDVYKPLYYIEINNMSVKNTCTQGRYTIVLNKKIYENEVIKQKIKLNQYLKNNLIKQDSSEII